MSRTGFSQTASPMQAQSAPAASAPAVAQDGLPGDGELSGVIGSQLSEPLSAMQYVIDEFYRTRRISSSQMSLLRKALTMAQKVAVQSQQISRLAEGKLRQSHERLHLDAIVRQALEDRAALFQQRGTEVYLNLKPVEVIVDPGLLSSLVDTAVDWASSSGQKLVVSLDIKNWPAHGILMFKTSQTIASNTHTPGSGHDDNLSWHLLTHTAHAMGLALDRVASTGEGLLMIEFPRTVNQLEGLTAVEVDGGGDSFMHSEAKPLAGHRVLLVTDDSTLRFMIKTICNTMSLLMDSVPTSAQAVRFCEIETPHLLIVDERLHDPAIDELRQDLHRTEPNFPFLEIANESNTLEMASWMTDSMTRLSRDSLREQLPSVLILELAKVI